MYQSMGFTSSYRARRYRPVLTLISFITLDKARFLPRSRRPRINSKEVTCMSDLFYGVAYYDEYMPEERLAKISP